MKSLNVLVTRWPPAGGIGFVECLAKTLGAAVWIKAYDAGHWLDLGEPFVVIAHKLQDAGVDVGAWGFHYGYPQEVDRLLECYTYRGGLAGYEGPRAGLLIDAEGHFERQGGEANARYQVDRIISADLPVLVYYTSFAFPRVHPSFPYAEFNRLSGGHVPQVYHNHHGWPDPFTAVMDTVDQHVERGLALSGVMLPVYDAGEETGWRPSPEDLHKAALAAHMRDVSSLWTWSWEYHRLEDWVALWLLSRLLGRLA